jgi:hypothetical protein
MRVKNDNGLAALAGVPHGRPRTRPQRLGLVRRGDQQITRINNRPVPFKVRQRGMQHLSKKLDRREGAQTWIGRRVAVKPSAPAYLNKQPESPLVGTHAVAVMELTPVADRDKIEELIDLMIGHPGARAGESDTKTLAVGGAPMMLSDERCHPWAPFPGPG